MKKMLYLLGCGGHAKSIADVLLFNNPKTEIVFVDENARPNEKIEGFDVLKSAPYEQGVFFPAFGDNAKREQFWSPKCPTIQSKDAYVSASAQVGTGNFIAHRAHIGPQAVIGNGCILNTSCVVEHEVHIGDFTHISVGSVVCGRSRIGNHVFLGAKSVVKDKVSICDHVVIGCGGVVIRDITEPGVYVGCPVRRIK